MPKQRKSVNLNVRVEPDVVDIVSELTEEYGNRDLESFYYQKDLVSMALRHFSKTLKERKVKPGDDIEKKLKL
jgi:hypothetical protein